MAGRLRKWEKRGRLRHCRLAPVWHCHLLLQKVDYSVKWELWHWFHTFCTIAPVDEVRKHCPVPVSVQEKVRECAVVSHPKECQPSTLLSWKSKMYLYPQNKNNVSKSWWHHSSLGSLKRKLRTKGYISNPRFLQTISVQFLNYSIKSSFTVSTWQLACIFEKLRSKKKGSSEC